MHVDSDDWIEPTMVEEAIKKQKESDYDIVSMDFNVHYPKYKKIVKQPDITNNAELTKQLIISYVHSVWARLIRTSLYKENNVRNIEGINYSEDLQIMPILTYYASKIGVLHKALYNYNCMNETAYTIQKTNAIKQQTKTTLQTLYNFFKNKSEEYIEAINICTAKSLCVEIFNKSHITKSDIEILKNYKNYTKYFPSQQKIFFLSKKPCILNFYKKVYKYTTHILFKRMK